MRNVNAIAIQPNPFILPYSEPIPATMVDILNIVSSQTGVNRLVMLSRKRDRETATARMIAMYLAYKSGIYTLQRIGHFYKRDHTTVISANRTVAGLICFDKQVREQVQEIEALLSGRIN